MLKHFSFLVFAVFFNCALAFDQVGLIIEISLQEQENIQNAIPITAANDNRLLKQDKVYVVDKIIVQPISAKDYHVTLDLFSSVSGRLDEKEIKQLEVLVEQLKKQTQDLNYSLEAKGYELGLFVHFADGTSVQYSAYNVHDLLKNDKIITFANLVLKVGAQGKLKTEWNNISNTFMEQEKFKKLLTRISTHDYEPHITLSNLYRWDGKTPLKHGKKARIPFGMPGEKDNHAVEQLVCYFKNMCIKNSFGIPLGFHNVLITTKKPGKGIGKIKEIILNEGT